MGRFRISLFIILLVEGYLMTPVTMAPGKLLNFLQSAATQIPYQIRSGNPAMKERLQGILEKL